MSTFVYCCLNDLKKQIINLRVNKVTAGKYQYYLVFSSFIQFFLFFTLKTFFAISDEALLEQFHWKVYLVKPENKLNLVSNDHQIVWEMKRWLGSH